MHRMNNNAPIIKITRPNVKGVLSRRRLFSRLDHARNCPLTWVSGPAGSGKTTLITSWLDARKLPCLWYQVDARDGDIATFFYYMGLAAKKAAPKKQKPLPLLTPEYLPGLSTFTLRYFEELYSRLRPPFVIVFDNYQDAPADSPLHELLSIGLGLVPKGTKVILLSRGEPPSALSRLRIGDKMNVIGWTDIRFTLDESLGLARSKGWKNATAAPLKRLHQQAQGWAAGLVLMMEVLKTREFDSLASTAHATQEVFDYFAAELFEKTDHDMQAFLLKTAYLPNMTVTMAEKLTGFSHAGRILSYLNRNHFFITSTRESVYQYHPLFRKFLQARLKESLNQEDIARLQRSAAGLLEESGQSEDAAVLFIESKDWQGIIGLALKHAPQLLSQGRSGHIEEWISTIPKDIAEGNPWLLFWQGMCKMFFDLRESRACLERSYYLFREQKDPTGLYMAWAGIIDTFVYEWNDFTPLDPWISEFEALSLEYPEFASNEIEARVSYAIFCALMYRQPQHPDLLRWENKVKEIVLHSNDIHLRTIISGHLIFYYTWWIGDLSKAAMLVNILRPAINAGEIAPLPLITWRAIEAAYDWMMGLNEECLSAVDDGLRLADATGIHFWDFMLCAQGFYGTLTVDDLSGAQKYLKRMALAFDPGCLLHAGHYHFLAAWEALYRGDAAQALAHAQTSCREISKTGVPFTLSSSYYELAEILIENGEAERGMAFLDESLKIARSIRCRTAEYQVWLRKAFYYLQNKQEDAGLDALAKAMAIGKAQRYYNNAGWRPSVMTALCLKAMEAGIELDHVRELIRRHNLIPDAPSFHIENWPWPLKIYTLGQFRIERDGKPLLISGKVPGKPLDMLKVLIAYGGGEVRAERIAEALWPDADGDAAYQSYETTLHRLRKMIGYDSAIVRQEGCITLDPRYCWTDVWAFEQMIEDGETKGQRTASAGVLRGTEKAVGMYKDHFLAGDGEKQWLMPMRERLRSKFLRATAKVGRAYEESGQWDKAVECYLKALEADSLAEEFYQRLMTCYHRLGRKAEALAVYNRCRDILSRVLGTGPSSKTKDIYLAIKQN